MMKIISLIVFVILLSWTWHVVHSTSPVDFETHSDIQLKMTELIENTIKTKKPEAQEIKIIKMWTQEVAEKKIKAQFLYRFVEVSADKERAERAIEGEAILVRDLSDNPTVDKWTIQSLLTKGDNINYTEGSVVTPDNQTPDENPSNSESKIPPSDNPMVHQ